MVDPWRGALAAALVLPVLAGLGHADVADAHSGTGTAAARAASPAPDRSAAEARDRSFVTPSTRATDLPPDWRESGDLAWTTSGDTTGLHLLVASSGSGYAWRTVASMSEPGFDTDRWIGNVCLTQSGRHAVVVYAPRQFTNRAALQDRGGFAAVVDVATGQVRKLGITVSLAYFNPGCGAGESAVLTQIGPSAIRRTRLHVLDAPSGRLTRRHELAGQVTSAVPVAGGIAAAGATGLIRIDAAGRQRTLAATRGAPFQIHPDAAGGVAFLEAHGDSTGVLRYAAGGTVRELARGPLTELQLAAGTRGRLFLTGKPQQVGALPTTVSRVDAPTTAEISTEGRLAVTHEASRDQDQVLATPGVARPVRLRARVAATGALLEFGMTPGVRPAAHLAQGGQPARLAGTVRHRPAAASAVAGEEAGRHTPVDPLRTCAVPRNDARTQVYQPHWRQVEWAVDQAVVGGLTTPRPDNWKGSGLPAWAPQGMFPRIGLTTGAEHRVPAQVLLGVLAQESNLWQASSHSLEGVYGNPLVGNFYGRDIYNDNPGDDWIIRWDKADCGYGIGQVTDGMRLGGSRTQTEQRAIALDYATNIAAGLRILAEKWNSVQALDLRINNNDPRRPENWFAALWAYNTGLAPRDAEAGNPTGCAPGPNCHDGRGNYGLGWTNNPVSSMYPANRKPFLNGSHGEGSPDDARHPQDWPYPEKVLGWAAFPIVKSNPFTGTYQAGYNQAWWDDSFGNRFRTEIKPPRSLFCNARNHCNPDLAQPCLEADFHCWWHEPATWKPNCTERIDGTPYDTCGHESIRYDPGLPEPADFTDWFRPNCAGGQDGADSPPGAWVVDDVGDATPSARPCADPGSNSGQFDLEFAADETGRFRSKVDFHQIGGGYAGHFWFARTYRPTNPTWHLTGTWSFNRSLHGWGRVLVHVPDHQSHTAQADYDVHLGDGRKKRRIVNAKSYRSPQGGHRWVDLGVFEFDGLPKVQLSNVTQDGDENDGITWDAVAIQPLPAKPRNFVVALGDSFSSGEGAVADTSSGSQYFKETDVDGDVPSRRNNCHRSTRSWPLAATLVDQPDRSLGTRVAELDPTLDLHELACSGAQTEHLLPEGVSNAFGDLSRGSDGEVSQLAAGFLDENTSLVTLSIGGNDAGWSKVIEHCLLVTAVDCPLSPLPGETEPAAEWLVNRINGPVYTSIQKVLVEIHRLAPHAKIVLMGYPQLLSDEGSCLRGVTWVTSLGTRNAGVSPGEATWLNLMADELAERMQQATDTLRVRDQDPVPAFFADPRPDFAGHGLCNAAPFAPFMNGAVLTLTPGEKAGPLDAFPRFGLSAQSFHPNPAGAEAYARALVRRIRQPDIDD